MAANRREAISYDGSVNLNGDSRLLFFTRFVRLFAYGALSVVLVLYLTNSGLSEAQTGLLLTLTLAGDTCISLMLTTQADRIGRRRSLVAGAFLMIMAGLAFAATNNFAILVFAGTLGVISPSGNEVGPFLPIEQAGLSETTEDKNRTQVLAWYTLAGAFATAMGSLFGGVIPGMLQRAAVNPLESYRWIVYLYAALGIVLLFAFTRLSPDIEVQSSQAAVPARTAAFLGVRQSRTVVLRLSALFGLDSFGGGFVTQSLAAYWFYLKFKIDPSSLGAIFFGANLLAGGSALIAARLAARFGLVRTMVFTHLPSNVLLILVPLMPTLTLAIVVLLIRFSISQMDVPARQSYIMAVVQPQERSAAAGITGVARTVGAAFAPVFAGMMFSSAAWISVPFFIAGGLKIAYDLLLYRGFVAHPLAEEG